MELKSQFLSEGYYYVVIVKGFICYEWRYLLAIVNEDGQWLRFLMLRLEKFFND